jgi:hypothetical protein
VKGLPLKKLALSCIELGVLEWEKLEKITFMIFVFNRGLLTGGNSLKIKLPPDLTCFVNNDLKC